MRISDWSSDVSLPIFDALGEQCVLGFTYGQTGNYGNAFIAYAGGYEVKRGVKSDAPVFGAIRQGQRHGKASKAIIEQDIRSLLAEPLEAARARLGIGEPPLYQEAHPAYRGRGIDPYNFLEPQAAAALPAPRRNPGAPPPPGTH